VCGKGQVKEEEGEMMRGLWFICWCTVPDFRLVLIGETTENYRSEQQASGIFLQTAAEFNLA